MINLYLHTDEFEQMSKEDLVFYMGTIIRILCEKHGFRLDKDYSRDIANTIQNIEERS